ncbi:hypothetical protein AB4Y86_19560 [Arthrobacter sp. 2YAF22_2]|uniref:MmyB family transcriptional regulator n=1 Tax=Arthrobacter sp. 2YAF22_2 TaxID=3233029 RepID=UPI003F9033A6
MTLVPAVVQNGRLDIVAANQLGRALFSELYAQARVTGRSGQPANFIHFLFLSPAAKDMYPDWDEATQQTVAMLRAEAGRVPDDRALRPLVGELSTRSDAFRTLWGSHDARPPAVPRLHGSTGNALSRQLATPRQLGRNCRRSLCGGCAGTEPRDGRGVRDFGSVSGSKELSWHAPGALKMSDPLV